MRRKRNRGDDQITNEFIRTECLSSCGALVLKNKWIDQGPKLVAFLSLISKASTVVDKLDGKKTSARVLNLGKRRDPIVMNRILNNTFGNMKFPKVKNTRSKKLMSKDNISKIIYMSRIENKFGHCMGRPITKMDQQ